MIGKYEIYSKPFPSRMKFYLFILYLMMVAILPSNSFAEMPKGPTILPEEMKLLPRWCQIRMLSHAGMRGYIGVHALKDRVPDHILRENKKWEKVIGEDIYTYLHHYCWALNWINRYKRFRFAQYKGAEKDLHGALSNAIGQFNFIRGHLRPKHKLYYSMLMNEAYVYQELKDNKKVAVRYMEVIKRKPGYALAYVKYAQFLNYIGKNGDAVKILKLGLKNTKGAKIIKQTMAAMGGR